MRIGGRFAAVAAAAAVVAAGCIVASSGARADAALSIRVDGNHFVDQTGATVALRGASAPSTEYWCLDAADYGDTGAYGQQLLDPAGTAAAMAAWHINAVRVPLNEDCWLGLHGEPAYGTPAAYQAAIVNWVAALDAAGIYAILDLHWTSAQTGTANAQHAFTSANSNVLWQQVAAAFAGNHAVLFDLFNEPYSPAYILQDAAHPLDWSCWRDGGCQLPVDDQNVPAGQLSGALFTAVGMQTLVTTVRNAENGWSHPLLLGGLAYANDLSSWLSYLPDDPAHGLVATMHSYQNGIYSSSTSWDTVLDPIAATHPVVFGEFAEGHDCISGQSSSGYDESLMDWADAHGAGYLAWAWWDIYGSSPANCAADAGGSEYALIDHAGDPVAPDGVALHDHLAAIFSGVNSEPPPTPVPTPTQSPTPSPTLSKSAAPPPAPPPAPVAVIKKLTPSVLKRSAFKPTRTKKTVTKTVVVTGAHFSKTAKVAVSLTGLKITKRRWISSTRLSLTVTVSQHARLGYCALSITNPGAKKVTRSKALDLVK